MVDDCVDSVGDEILLIDVVEEVIDGDSEETPIGVIVDEGGSDAVDVVLTFAVDVVIITDTDKLDPGSKVVLVVLAVDVVLTFVVDGATLVDAEVLDPGSTVLLVGLAIDVVSMFAVDGVTPVDTEVLDPVSAVVVVELAVDVGSTFVVGGVTLVDTDELDIGGMVVLVELAVGVVSTFFVDGVTLVDRGELDMGGTIEVVEIGTVLSCVLVKGVSDEVDSVPFGVVISVVGLGCCEVEVKAFCVVLNVDDSVESEVVTVILDVCILVEKLCVPV